MPMWSDPQPAEDGQVRYQLDGHRIGAMVNVMPAERLTLVTVALAVDGTDEATVDRCKQRAEQLLVEAQRGEVR